MKSHFRRLSVFRDSPIATPLLLALVTFLAYGWLLPGLGFYWDELPLSWIRYELGPQALTSYFSSYRPVWGMLYQMTTRILPQIPLDWQIFGLICRWASAVLVWAILGELWPGRREFAWVASLFFLLYPGFNQQWLSFLYSHFFIVFCFYLFSLLCMLWSLRQRQGYWRLTLLALIPAAANLWMMEYYFTLELLRPFMIFRRVGMTENGQKFPVRLRRALVLWAPYLAVFLVAVLWRLFVFNNQNYTLTLIPHLQSAPLNTIPALIGSVSSSLYTVSLAAWGQIFHFPNPLQDGLPPVINYWVVILLTGFLVAIFLVGRPEGEPNEPGAHFWPIGLGLIALLTAGIPFWLTGLQISLAFPASRFTLPFMLGVTLLLAGMLELLPRRMRFILATVLIILAAGRQALWADDFQRDWADQKTLFWQMVWRAPGIKPNTLVLLNDNALQFYADNSLSAALNWVYGPAEPSSNHLSYLLFFPSSRLGGSLPSLQPGQPVTFFFNPATFAGNTSQTLAFYYRPPACLRLLDPDIDTQNQFLPDRSLMRDAAWLSSPRWITPVPGAHLPQIYGPEPPHGWCYYFEQADLARQMGDWQRVAQIGDAALKLGDPIMDPTERFVFIEGYAHTGDWTKMREQSNLAYQASPSYVAPLLCQLLTRIDRQDSSSPELDKRVSNFRVRFSCPP